MISAKLLQLMVDAFNDGVVVAEEEGDDNILIYANPAFQRLTGYAPEDILYRDCRFLQNDDRAQSALPLIREAIRNRQPSRDRKSTRLNSSHVRISYAVFCLKKKK